MPAERLSVVALYPRVMNIYADRGNLLFLQERCEWRGIGFELASKEVGDPLDGERHDIYYIGGGQDRDQRLCAEDLLESGREALAQAAERGAVVLGVCGGYQLLGHSYALDGEQIEGVGLLDVQTVREEGPRLIGNVAIEATLGERTMRLAGFENHGGRTRLGFAQRPLGKVLKGHGNDGDSGLEGALSANVIGTYLHGPLLPKNPELADWLIATGLGIEESQLAPLDDRFPAAAHADALRVAGVGAG